MGDLHLLDDAIVSLAARRAITRTGDRGCLRLLGAETGFDEQPAAPGEPLLVPA